MKKIKLLMYSLTMILCWNTNSQIILDRSIKNDNLPENFDNSGNYYYKDVHQYLEWFEGTWEYVNGNEKFEITLTKVIEYHEVEPQLNLNFYEDGIVLQYRKYVDNQLTFESPAYQDPNFFCIDGNNLEGNIQDYGRISKSTYMPLTNLLLRQGGNPIYPFCTISKIPLENNKVKFLLNDSYFQNYYDFETYAGQPYYSIPDNIVMSKVN